jgi:hypothetical protein
MLSAIKLMELFEAENLETVHSYYSAYGSRSSKLKTPFLKAFLVDRCQKSCYSSEKMTTIRSQAQGLLETFSGRMVADDEGR